MSNCKGLTAGDKFNIAKIVKKGENLSDDIESVLDYLSIQKGAKLIDGIEEEAFSNDIVDRFRKKYPDFEFKTFKDFFDKKLISDSLFSKRLGISEDREGEEEAFTEDLTANTTPEMITSYRELILSKFKNYQTGLKKLNDMFKRKIYSEILIDFQEGKFYDGEKINDRLHLLKESMLKDTEEKKEILENLEKKTNSEPLISLILSKSKNNWLSDYYVDVMAAEYFDILLTKHFGNIFSVSGENQYNYENIQKLKTGWQDKQDFGDAMEAMNSELEIHIFNTPVINVVKDKSGNKEFLLTGEYLDKNKLKKIVAENSLYEGSNIGGVLNEKLRKDAAYDPYIAALYYRFFSPEPIIIKDEKGEERVQHSIMSMALKYKKEGKDYSKLKAILTNLTSHIAGTVRNYYLDITKDGLVIKSVSSRTKTEIMDHIEETMRDKLSKLSKKVKVTYDENDVPVKADFDDGKVVLELIKGQIRVTQIDGVAANELNEKYLNKIFNLYGIDTTSLNNKGFFDTYKIQNHGFDSLNAYLFHLFVTTDLNANHLQDLDLKEQLKKAGVSEKALDSVYERVKKDGFISPNLWNTTTGLEKIKLIYDIVNKTQIKDKILNFENKMVPVYGEKAPIHELPLRIKRISDSPELMKNSPLKDNAFVGKDSNYTIKHFAYLDGYQRNELSKPVSHTLLGVDAFTDLNINKLFGKQLLNSDFHSAYLTFYIPSDKKRYPIPLIYRDGEYLPILSTSKGPKLNTRILFDEYFNTVGKHHLGIINKTLDIWNSYLTKLKIVDKPFENIRELRDFLDNAHIKEGVLNGLPFVKNLDYIIKGDEVRIRPDMVEFNDIFSSKERTIEYVKFHLDHFVDQLTGEEKPIKGKTTGRSVKFKIDREINEAIAKRFGKKWAKGDIKIDGEINPFITGYFLHNIILSQNLTALHLGSPFQYKPGKSEISSYPGLESKDLQAKKSYYDSLNEYMHNSVVDMTKRAASFSSVFYQPVVEKLDQHGRPIGLYNGLPERSHVFYFKDIKGFFHSLFDGKEVAQDKFDGAFFIHPLELIRTINSYGGKFSGMDSNILKDVTSIYDPLRGVLQYEKKASYQMTSELMALSDGNGKFDMKALNEIMLSYIPYKPVIEYFEDGLTINQRIGHISELTNIIIQQTGMDEQQALEKAHEIIKLNSKKCSLREDGEIWPYVDLIRNGVWELVPMKNAHELFLHMGGFTNDNIWNDMIEVENRNPDIAYQYIGKLGSDSSVKTGIRNLNNDLYEAIRNNGEGLVATEVSNEHTGLQLNPKHNPEDKANALTITTQKYQALALNSEMTPETDKVYDAIYTLTNHLKGKIPKDPVEFNQFLRNNILSESTEFNSLTEKMADNTWSFNDRSIFRKIFNKINKIFERAGIHHKFNGGMFVVTPVSDIVMLYDLPDGRSVTRPEFLHWLKLLPEAEREKYKNLQARNLRWSSYYKIDPKTKEPILDSNGKTIELEDQPEWNHLKEMYYVMNDFKNGEPDVYQKYKALAEEVGIIPIPEEHFGKEHLLALQNKIRRQYSDLLNTGEWYERPSEVLMPNLFKKEFQFGKNELVYLGEIQGDPYFFLRRRLSRRLNLDAVLNNVEEALIKDYNFKEDDPELSKVAFEVWKIAHEENPKGEFAKKYKGEINYLKNHEYLLNDMESNPINIDHLMEMRDDFLNNLIGDNARIPGTGLASVNVIKIAGFMESLDNAVGIPIESMYVKGEDLDIDKGNIQIFDVSRHPETRGKRFDFYVWKTDENGKLIKAKNDYSGKVMTLDEVKQNFPEDFNRNESLYKNKDWYESGVKNYIIGKTIEILSNSKNALDSNRPIGLGKSMSFADNKPVDDYFSQDNPLYLSFLSTINKVGSQMIGIEATGLKGFSTIFHAAQKMLNRGEIVNTLLRSKNTGIPTLFHMKFNGEDYTSVANTSDLNRIKLEMKLSTLSVEQLEKVKDRLEELRVQHADSDKAIEYYSELINAATDNAKHLVLGRINVTPFTSNLVNSMIATGVPYSQIMSFVNSPEFIKLTDVLENYSEKIITRSGKVLDKETDFSLNSYSYEKFPREALNIIKQINDKYDTSLKDWIKFSEKFSTIATSLGINQGLKVTAEEYYKLSNRINKAIKDYLGKYSNNPFTIEDYFSADTNTRKRFLNRIERKAGKFNLLRIIEENPHFKGFFETMVEARKAIDSQTPIAKTADQIVDKTFEDFGKSILKFTDAIQLHRNAQDYIYKFIGDQYMQKIGVLHTMVGNFDLNTISGRTKFVNAFDNLVIKLREKYPGNIFISKLRKYTDNFPGTNQPYSIYGVGSTRRMEPDVFEQLKLSLSSLDKEDIKSLFVYNLSNGLNKRYGFEELFSPEDIRDWNEALHNFKGFDKIHPDAISFFMNSNPYTFKYLSEYEIDDYLQEVYREQDEYYMTLPPDADPSGFYPTDSRIKHFNRSEGKYIFEVWNKKSGQYEPIKMDEENAFLGIPFKATPDMSEFYSIIETENRKDFAIKENIITKINGLIKSDLSNPDPIPRNTVLEKETGKNIYFIKKKAFHSGVEKSTVEKLAHDDKIFVTSEKKFRELNRKVRNYIDAPIVKGERFILNDGRMVVASLNSEPKITYVTVEGIKFQAHSFVSTKGENFFLLTGAKDIGHLVSKLSELEMQRDKLEKGSEMWHKIDKRIKEINKKYLILNYNAEYGYVIPASKVKNLENINKIVVDEDAIREEIPEPEKRNKILLDIFNPKFTDIAIATERAVVDSSSKEPKPEESSKEPKPDKDPVVKPKREEPVSDVVTRNVIESFAEVIGEQVGIPIRTITSEQIRSNPEISNVFLSKKGFVLNNVLYLNVDNASLETPIHEMAHLWINIIKMKNPNLYSLLLDTFSNHPIAKEVMTNHPGLSGDALQEEIFAEAIGNKIYKDSGLSNVQDGDVNAYINNVNDIVNRLFTKSIGDEIELIGGKNNLFGEAILKGIKEEGNVFKHLKGFAKAKLEEVYGELEDITQKVRDFQKENSQFIKRNVKC